jgi:hypothetical protein
LDGYKVFFFCQPVNGVEKEIAVSGKIVIVV